MKTTKNKGFTLLELLAVVFIIIILVSMIFSSARYMQRKALEGKCQAQFAALQLAIEAYKSNNGYYPPTNLASPYAAGTGADKEWAGSRQGIHLLGRFLDADGFGGGYLQGWDYNHGPDGAEHYVDSAGGTVQAGWINGSNPLANPAGNEYQYVCPGTHNLGGYDLWVIGVDNSVVYRNWTQ